MVPLASQAHPQLPHSETTLIFSCTLLRSADYLQNVPSIPRCFFFTPLSRLARTAMSVMGAPFHSCPALIYCSECLETQKASHHSQLQRIQQLYVTQLREAIVVFCGFWLALTLWAVAVTCLIHQTVWPSRRNGMLPFSILSPGLMWARETHVEVNMEDFCSQLNFVHHLSSEIASQHGWIQLPFLAVPLHGLVLLALGPWMTSSQLLTATNKAVFFMLLPPKVARTYYFILQNTVNVR